MHHNKITRRNFLAHSAAAVATLTVAQAARAQTPPFALNYNLASSLYGELPLDLILPEARKIGATTIDLWPRPHGNQREQMDELGRAAFQSLLDKHGVTVGMITRYDLGPHKLHDEMAIAQSLGARIIVTGSGNVAGDTLKARMQTFVENLKPHLARAEETGVTLAIENHANSLLHTPDSIRYLAEFAPSARLGVALAPYHLPQDPALIAAIIRDIGPRLVHFYAWEHGHGAHEKMPKVLEMKQLPGYGPLDFAPIVAALRDIDYQGWTSVFMHPVPRGIPILPTAAASTAALNRSRAYLDALL